MIIEFIYGQQGFLSCGKSMHHYTCMLTHIKHVRVHTQTRMFGAKSYSGEPLCVHIISAL